MASAQSAQEFVRALRAPVDPPHPDGPFKIDIARQAWDNTILYVPNKGEVIADWLLTRLLKDKSKERASNPVFDTRYWSLLYDILSADAPRANPNLRTTKPWLVSVVNRVPIAPIVTSFYSMSSPADQEATNALHALVTRCLVVLWPLAVPKCSPETLLDCFGALLSRFPSRAAAQNLTQLDSAIVSSYRAALSNATHKKKLYTNFLQSHLLPWLECMRLPNAEHVFQHVLVSDLYTSGIETIFSIDVLRQAGDQKCDAALKKVLIEVVTTSSSAVLEVLPRLFKSFVQSAKRHRSALFSQGSTQAPSDTAMQVQVAGMAFFTLCDDLLAMTPDSDQTWRTRIALLEIVDVENLFNARDDHSALLLRRNGELAIQALGSAWKEQHLEQSDSALEILSALARIDYDIMSSMLPIIIPKLVSIPRCNPSVLTYLGLLLDYHSKIRALYTFIFHWFEAFSIEHLQAVSEDARDVYLSACSGPVLNLVFLDRLSKAAHSFLTPGQISDTVQFVLQKWKGAFDAFKEQDKSAAADRGDGSRKIRNVGASSGSAKHVDPDWAAVTFALLSKAAAIILTALPVNSVLEDDRKETGFAIREACSSVVSRALKDTFKVLGGGDRRETWRWQIAACAALQAHYGLITASQFSLDLRHDDKYISKMLTAVLAEETLPELGVGMLRNVLHQSADDEASCSNVFNTLLHYLERHSNDSDASWNGRAHCLTSNAGHNEGAVALFHLLLDRWLPLLNEHAPAEQLKRLVKVMMIVRPQQPSISVSKPTQERRLTIPTILAESLRNAQFWELRRLRDVFLAELQEQTATLDNVDLRHSLSDLKNSSRRPPIKGIRAISATYETLLYAPEEYLPRNLRAEFLRRALAADVAMGLYLESDTVPQMDNVRSLAIVREFIRRTFAHLGAVDHSVVEEYLDYLMRPLPPSAAQAEQLQSSLAAATVELVGMHLSAVFKSASKDNCDSSVRVTQSFIRPFLSQAQADQRDPFDSFWQQGLLRLINTVTTYKLVDFSEQLKSALTELQVDVVSQYLPQMQRIASQNSSTVSISDRNDVLQTWAALLSLGHWLRSTERCPLNFGPQLVSKLLAEPPATRPTVNVCMAVLAVLVEELQASPMTDRHRHMEGVIAAYLAFSRLYGSAGVTILDDQLSSAFKALEVVDFAYMLDFILEALSTPGTLSSDDIASLVHLSNVMIHDAPEGSLKVTQKHVTTCLSIFANQPGYLAARSLRHETLDFISRHFNDHPASIRIVDLSSVWSILGHLVAGSAEHDKATDCSVFHQIVAIVNALIRLRRDLVLCTLPHLGMVLRQLTMSLRTLRPQLGIKQSTLILNTLPRWVGASEPLTAEESKALARLLTTLITKTIVRTFASPTEMQKAESLVRPFSKHAAAVLTAYIDALNDPLCFLSTQVRRELQPGLFALCEMLGEQNRDSLMVSALDAGGKATMKALWKEYEKQRYTGKG